ncbi:MAG: glucokinase [Alphaproteobacteria bacterium]
MADLGATNARLAIVNDFKDLIYKSSYKISNFKTVDDLINHYLNEFNVSRENLSGILGVAAPIIGNEINFVNIDFSFSVKEIEKSFFSWRVKII